MTHPLLTTPAIGTPEAPALSARMLGKSFPNGPVMVPVIRDLDLTIPGHSMTLVKGPSGCGKSTLLAMLAGLTEPDHGGVQIGDTDLWALPTAARDAFRLAQMGFIFQGAVLFPALTAAEQIRFVLEQMGIPAAEARDRAHAALDDVGLTPRRDLRPAALSGGEKQRVSIACALAKRPRVIFADEPTSALDSENGRIVGTLLRDTAHRSGAAVVCVTHDDRLTTYADRILHMEDGRITATNHRPQAQTITENGQNR
ncbi:ABC transporter ATP-binding protein [Paracoccus sp. p3-h83]